MVEPAETGQPEMSREFAKRICKLTLHGSRARGAEGVSGMETEITELNGEEEHKSSPYILLERKASCCDLSIFGW